MSDALLLDTHALWLDSGDEQLRPATRAASTGAGRPVGPSFSRRSAPGRWRRWSTAATSSSTSLDRWLDRFLGRPGVQAVPLEHGTAIRAYQLHHLEHRDPGDRLLIASAIDLGCPLVTYDDRLRQFARLHGPKYGLSLAE